MWENGRKIKDGSRKQFVLRNVPKLAMDIEKYEFWFDALRDNKREVVGEILNASDKEETNRLLNGWFRYEDDEYNRLHTIFDDTKRSDLKATRPFILTVLYGSFDVLSCLLEHGADPDCTEEDGSNIFHVMSLIVQLFPPFEETSVKAYTRCSNILGKDRMLSLLQTENSNGLRPLELAAKLGCCKIVKAILETPGVYLTKENTRGMVHYQWIDVTEYETTDPQLDRRGKSPLGFLALMDEDTLLKTGTMDLFSWPPFQMWIKAKISSSTIFVFVWFMLRFLHVACYMVLAADGSLLRLLGGVSEKEITANSTVNYNFVFCSSYTQYSFSSKTRWYLFLYVAIQAYCSIFFDIVEFIVIRVRQVPSFFLGSFNVTRKFVVTRYLYFSNQFCMSVFLAVGPTLQLFQVRIFSAELMQGITLVCIVNITFSFMFFFQMLPVVGIYVTTIRRMLRDLLNFSLLYLLFVTPFSLYFLVFYNTNSKFECLQAFSNIGESFYSTFRMMLNALDLHAHEVHTPYVLYLVHVIYVFTVAILLINFLIAVMSTSAARIAVSEKLIINLERMYVALILDFRLGWILRRMFNKCKAKSMVFKDSKYYVLNIEYR